MTQQKDKEPSKAGRPLALSEKDKERITKLASFGFTDEEIAGVFGITYQTLNNYKKRDPEFFASLKHAKANADSLVIDSLLKRATGSTVKEQRAVTVSDGDAGSHVEIVTVEKELPPDSTSMIFWLKNRQPDKFRDKVDVEQTGEIKIELPSDKLTKLK